MNFKKAINYSALESFFIEKGFSIASESGDIVITSPYGYYIAISQPWKDSDMIFLDCNLISEIGLRDFIREWPNVTNLYDYIVNICYPLLSNVRGWASLKYGIVLKQFNCIYFARFRDDSNTILFEYLHGTPFARCINPKRNISKKLSIIFLSS